MTFQEAKDKFKTIEAELAAPELVHDTKKLMAVSKQHSDLRLAIELINRLADIQKRIIENKELRSGNDKEMAAMANEELPELEKEAEQLEAQINDELNPANPLDKKDAIIEIRGGTGGDESANFAADLYRMYVHLSLIHISEPTRPY